MWTVHRNHLSRNLKMLTISNCVIQKLLLMLFFFFLTLCRSYATFSSWPIVVLICLSAALMQASRNGNDLWLSHWVDSADSSHNLKHHSTSFYLVIICIFLLWKYFLKRIRGYGVAALSSLPYIPSHYMQESCFW